MSNQNYVEVSPNLQMLTPCRMTGVTLHSHVHYKENQVRARTEPSCQRRCPCRQGGRGRDAKMPKACATKDSNKGLAAD